MTLALQSPVASKSEKPKKGKYSISMSVEAYDELEVLAEKEDRSVSWLIEKAVRQMLGLTKQTNPEEK